MFLARTQKTHPIKIRYTELTLSHFSEEAKFDDQTITKYLHTIYTKKYPNSVRQQSHLHGKKRNKLLKKNWTQERGADETTNRKCRQSTTESCEIVRTSSAHFLRSHAHLQMLCAARLQFILYYYHAIVFVEHV